MFSYENQGTNTYLVYGIGQNDVIDSMSLGMLANNRIPGLAATLFTQMDASRFIKYNVTAHVSASQLFSGIINKKRLLGVFSGITDAMLSAEDYMIDPRTILLQLDYIFVDVSSCDTILICLPLIQSNEERLDLGAFFKGIMFSTQFDQTENCDYVAKIINYLNSTPTFSIADFKQLLEGLKGAGTDVRKQAQVVPKQQPQLQRSQTQQPSVVQQQSWQNYQSPMPPQTPSTISAAPQSQPVIPQMQQAYPQEQAAARRAAPAQQTQIPPVSGNGGSQAQHLAGTQEEAISLFYLLQHYNKDNAARYKAQKETKKQPNGAPAPTATQKPKKEKKKGAQPPNYAVPGMPQEPSFAIPGQAAPAVPANTPPLMGKPYQSPPQANVQTAYTPPVQQTVIQGTAYQAQQIPQMPQMQPQTRPMSFGETTVLGGGNIGETTVLGSPAQNMQLCPHLIRSKNNERIDINKPVFRVGKEKSYVDYFVSDNTAVSRSHANIISRDGEYFVVDTNSTNHTFVNGSMILSNSETKISHGDKIRLANEEFEFRLY